MKLNSVLILSFSLLFSGNYVENSMAASAGSTSEKLSLQLKQEQDKVKSLEAEIIKLRGTIRQLKAASSPQSSSNKKIYTIKEGETITQIANKHGISRKELMEINNISENQQIYIGDELKIPAAPAPTEPVIELADNTKPAPVKEPAKVSPKTPAPKPTPTKVSPIAWTKTKKPEKKEDPKMAPPAKSLTTKAPPEKTKEPEKKPVEVAKVEPKPTKVTPPAPKKESPSLKSSPMKDVAKVDTKTDNPDFTYYTIKFGDNLGKIAKKHGISIGVLMNFNDITNPDKISGGQKLKIPSKEKAKTLSKVKPLQKSGTPTLTASSDNKPLPGDDYGVYIVQSGDTLYELARDFFTTEKEIQSLNKMGSKTHIVPGQELIVPTAEYLKKGDLANN